MQEVSPFPRAFEQSCSYWRLSNLHWGTKSCHVHARMPREREGRGKNETYPILICSLRSRTSALLMTVCMVSSSSSVNSPVPFATYLLGLRAANVLQPVLILYREESEQTKVPTATALYVCNTYCPRSAKSLSGGIHWALCNIAAIRPAQHLGFYRAGYCAQLQQYAGYVPKCRLVWQHYVSNNCVVRVDFRFAGLARNIFTVMQSKHYFGRGPNDCVVKCFYIYGCTEVLPHAPKQNSYKILTLYSCSTETCSFKNESWPKTRWMNSYA